MRNLFYFPVREEAFSCFHRERAAGIYFTMSICLQGRKVHFIGVGGISMSALIKIARRLGAVTSGSDREDSPRLASLGEEGYDVYVGVRPEVAAAADLVVYTAAIPSDHPERLAAKCEMSRAEFLARISELFDKTVAVAGTHGKTTVSAMIASVLASSGRGFSAHIGGIARNFGSNIFLSGREIFVTEACEYKDSFLALTPDIGIVLNAEIDHGDYFADEESVYESFRAFLSRISPGGTAVLGEGVAEKLGLSSLEGVRICAYGDEFISEDAEGGGFYLRVAGDSPKYFTTTAKGRHNRINAAVAARTAMLLGVPEDRIRMGLAGFLGVKRRYERVGRTARGAEVIEDYAHHPSEIAAVTDVAREETTGRLIVVFEPHTYSRTATLFKEFSEVLAEADVLVMLPTYSAREVPADGLDAKTLFCATKAREKYYFSRYDDVKGWLDRITDRRDTVLLLGAGSIEKLAESFRTTSRP